MPTLQQYMSRSKPVPKQWAGFLDAVRKGDHTTLVKMGAEPIRKANNQIESNGIYGGYAVPPDFNLSIATATKKRVSFTHGQPWCRCVRRQRNCRE